MTGTRDLPNHVKQHLIQTGTLTTDGLGRKAQLRTCSTCRALVIVGLDTNRCAIRAVADPTALDQVGELLALLAGRHTYELWGRELEHRNQFTIRAGIRKPVISEHQCGNSQTPSPQILALFMKPDHEIKGEVPY